MTQLCPVQLKNMPGLHAVQVHTITHDHTHAIIMAANCWHTWKSCDIVMQVFDALHVFLMCLMYFLCFMMFQEFQEYPWV